MTEVNRSLQADVVVVGAGPAGLMTARTLTEAGLDVVVLEARARVGGRTWSSTVDGAWLEIGGQWITSDQTELLSLLKKLGKTTYKRHRTGSKVYLGPDGRRTVYSGSGFPVSTRTAAELERMTTVLDQLAAEVDPERPWSHPRARELDMISFHHWLRLLSSDEEACDLIGLFIAGGMLTKPAHSFSALQAIFMASSAGSFSKLVDEDFILDLRVTGGMQSVSEAMAEALADRVVLQAPVRKIGWGPEGVHVVADDVAVSGRYAVVAVPPPLLSRISFDPPLPRRQQQMHQHLSMGLVIKVHAVYHQPFWRDDGLSGTCFGAASIVQEIYDNSHDGDSRGTLAAFVPEEKADAMFALSAKERRADILMAIAEFLGPQAITPEAYYESDWAADEWTRGAYAASFDLGGLTRYGADQRKPVGPIHFACSDLAGEGYQHVDGALRIGRHVAEAIAATRPSQVEHTEGLVS